MTDGEMFAQVVWQLGPVAISSTVLTTWGILILLLGASVWLSRRLQQDQPGRIQVLAEGVYIAIEDAIAAVAPNHVQLLFPFIATLWIFLVIANLVGLIRACTRPPATCPPPQRWRLSYFCRCTGTASATRD